MLEEPMDKLARDLAVERTRLERAHNWPDPPDSTAKQAKRREEEEDG